MPRAPNFHFTVSPCTNYQLIKHMREPTCGCTVKKAVVSPAHQGSSHGARIYLFQDFRRCAFSGRRRVGELSMQFQKNSYIVDSLSNILSRAARAGHISPVSSHLIPEDITHLQYADNTIIMVDLMTLVSPILNFFFSASRHCLA